jgi:hypothetical protein
MTTNIDRTYYDECLNKWDHPTGSDSIRNFIGTIPTGYCIYSQNRESSILELVNFKAILADLGGEGEHVEIIRHKHWACGWIEYLMVSRDAPTELLDRCVEIARALDSDPVYDDESYSNEQYTAVTEYWLNASMRERVALCSEAGVSIFRVRYHNDMPDKVFDNLMNGKRFY